jgi:glycosyltransferase involved in cell wall biosynthesis
MFRHVTTALYNATTEPMKILIANKFFYRNGGSEVVMFQERDHLLRSGFSVVDFAMRDDRNLDSPHSDHFVGSRQYHGAGKRLRALTAAASLVHSGEAVRRISALIRRERPDLMHCHNIYHQLTPSIIPAAKALGVPVALTLHDYKPVCPVYTRLRAGRVCSDCTGSRFDGVLRHRCAEGSLARSGLLLAEALFQRLKGSYEAVDAVIAPSRFLAEAVSPARFPRHRVHVIPNGVDTDAIAPAYGDGGYVLYMGRLSAEKGVETLLASHRRHRGRWHLKVAGTGPLETALRGQYADAEFLGHVGGEELDRVIRGAGCVVVPSEWYENCPMTVLEAMAYGKAVVASRIGGIPELVADGETGLLCEPGDSGELGERLAALMADPARRAALGRAARRRAESEFSLAVHNRRLLEVYGELLPREELQGSHARDALSH